MGRRPLSNRDKVQFPSFPVLGGGKLGNCPQVAISTALPVSRAVSAFSGDANTISTTDLATDYAGLAAVADSLTPVTRHFRADPAALDALVEALYKLLIETPELQSASVPERPESACIRRPHE